MTDVDRYITGRAWSEAHLLRAVLPGILAAHRRDVLAEARHQVENLCSRSRLCLAADEVADD